MSTELSFVGVSQSEIDEIRQLQADIELATKMTIDKVIQAGGKLSAIRNKLKHGQWLPFVKHVGISDQTARNYIRVWENRHTLKSQNILNLTEAYTATLPAKSDKSDSSQMSPEESKKLARKIGEHLDNLVPTLISAGNVLIQIRDNKWFKHPEFECRAATFAEYVRKAGWTSDLAQIAIDLWEALEASSEADDVFAREWSDIMPRLLNTCMAMYEKQQGTAR